VQGENEEEQAEKKEEKRKEKKKKKGKKKRERKKIKVLQGHARLLKEDKGNKKIKKNKE